MPVTIPLASLILPGLGQLLSGRRARGLSILGLTLTLLGLIWWSLTPQDLSPETRPIPLKGDPANLYWLVVPVLIWAWNVWDAARPNVAPGWIPALLSTTMFFVIGWQVAEINPPVLASNIDRVMLIVRPMLRPDFIQPRAEEREGWVEIIVPCPTEAPAAADSSTGEITLTVDATCGAVGETLTVTAAGLTPDVPVELVWQSPIGDFFVLREADDPTRFRSEQPDAQGGLTTALVIPNAIPPGVDPTMPQEQRLYLRQSRPLGGWELSTNGGFILQGIYETIALALMATTLGTLGAFPFSFLAARNLMGGNAFTLVVYVAVRTILNIVRSIKSLIIAIVFVVIIGLGPFAGMMAVTVHTIAALGKLFSEVIEGIDPGPIEAIRATGANWLQIVRYGVLPQVVPAFTAFTIYRWEINVRASTIIGVVGGGGIGFFLIQWINLSDYRAVSAAFLAILVVVQIMDFVSARLRERLA